MSWEVCDWMEVGFDDLHPKPVITSWAMSNKTGVTEALDDGHT